VPDSPPAQAKLDLIELAGPQPDRLVERAINRASGCQSGGRTVTGWQDQRAESAEAGVLGYGTVGLTR
jgi:hypothetical protein